MGGKGRKLAVRNPGQPQSEFLAVIHFPVAVRVIAQLQQAVFGVVPLSATGADQVPAPILAFAVVFLGNGKAGATTAWD
jgi:hypothetical protein